MTGHKYRALMARSLATVRALGVGAALMQDVPPSAGGWVGVCVRVCVCVCVCARAHSSQDVNGSREYLEVTVGKAD